MKLEFYTSTKRDILLIKRWFNRVKEVFGEEKFIELIRKYYPDCPIDMQEMIKYFKKNNNKFLKQMEKASCSLKEKWRGIEKEFFEEVEKITGFKWKYQTYKCHLTTSFVFGGCYDAEKGNEISIFPLAKHADPIEIIFHELIHLHFWDMLDTLKIKYDKKEKLIAKGKFWDLSEMAVNIPLSKLKIPSYKYIPDSHIYSEHTEIWKKIKVFWNGNFKEFILKSIDYIQKLQTHK
jgi:hypothetical protein